MRKTRNHSSRMLSSRFPTGMYCKMNTLEKSWESCPVRSKLNKFDHVWEMGPGPCPEEGLGRVMLRRQTDKIENINFPQLLWRTVKTSGFLSIDKRKQLYTVETDGTSNLISVKKEQNEEEMSSVRHCFLCCSF